MNTDDPTRQRLMAKFRSVTQERLDRLNNAFLQLQTAPDNVPLTQELMREIHTLKGEARMMGLSPISLVAHRTEDLLQKAREAHFAHGSGVHTLVLAGYDLISELLREGDAQQAEQAAQTFAARVNAYLKGELAPTRPAEAEPVLVNEKMPPPQPQPATTAQTSALVSRARRESVRVDTHKIERITDITGDLVLGQTRLEQALRELTDVVDDWRRSLGALRRQGRGQRTLSQQQIAALVQQLGQKLAHVDDVNSHLMRTREDVFSSRILLDDLEDRVRDLRLVPIAALFDRMPRAMHDLAEEQQKRLRVTVSGNDMAVDADVLDRLGDPLVHLLRNCVDHGIESPAQRRAVGKSEEGHITLSAAPRGTFVEIVVRDDGRGIDPGKLLETAVYRGFVSARDAQNVSRETALSWIFKPGFSTREHVTDISGRGVGLDAVWQQVSALGGTVEYETDVGRGTTFRITAPVSTVLSRALVVDVGGDQYAVPSESVMMALDIPENAFESVAGGRCLRIQNERVSVLDLSILLGQPPTQPRDGRHSVVVLHQRGARRAFLVPRLVGERQVIQRKLDPFCENLAWVTGTALIDGGGLALLLNLNELMLSSSAAAGRAVAPAPVLKDAPLVLVVDDSEMTRDMVVGLLRANGYRVREAVDGADALVKAAAEPPALILTDLEMPRCNGFELLRSLRADANLSSTPVVVFSTLGAETDKQRAAELGANAYIVKTNFKEDELVGMVSRHILQSLR